jgi:flagellar basal body-associated protein FliL
MGRCRILLTGFLTLATAWLAVAPMALAKAEAKSDGPEMSTNLVQLQPLAVNIFRSNYQMGKVEVLITLDLPNLALRERTQLSQPRLRAAYVQTISSFMYDLPPRTPPDLDQLTDALQHTTNRVLGRPGAKLLLGFLLVN